MKAALLNRFGEFNVIEDGIMADPLLEGSNVIVKLEYAAINHLDIWVRKGSPAYPVTLPHILGADGAGTVVQIGKNSEGVSIGDRVLILPGLSCGNCTFCKNGQDNQCDTFEILGAKRNGTYAAFVSIPDQNVFPIPASLSFDEAASFSLTYLTAWHMLVGRAQIQKGEKVLIVGGSAGVSVAAIQISKALGAETFVVTSSEQKLKKLESLKPDHLFHAKEGESFSPWISELTQGKGVQIAFEHVGPATWKNSIESLSKYGRLVTCGNLTGPNVTVELRQLFGRDLSLLGARMGTQKEFMSLFKLIESEKIKPFIDTVFPLNQAAQAHKYVEEKNQVGKVLLKINA